MKLTGTQIAPQSPAPGANPQADPQVEQLLAQLKDIQQPAAIGWWPPAPGWWLLGILILALLAGGTYLFVRYRRAQQAKRYRAEGISLLRNLQLKEPNAVVEINSILKRVAVVSYGRSACAQLTGQRWIQFLQQTSESEIPISVQKTLLEYLYRKQVAENENLQVLRDYAIEWVGNHNTQAFSQPAPGKMDAESAEVTRV